MIPFYFTGSTRSRRITPDGPAAFGGLLVVNTSANGVSVAVMNSGSSVNLPGVSGSTSPVPFTIVRPGDHPFQVETPNAGLHCDQGIFLFFPNGKISGCTAVVYWR
jgi:hypothetical protein